MRPCACLGLGGSKSIIIPNQPVATVNGVDIHKDPYAHMQNWQSSQVNGQIQQYQQEITSLGSNKKNASLSQALQQQVTQMQSQLQTVPTDALTRMEEAIVLKQSASKQVRHHRQRHLTCRRSWPRSQSNSAVRPPMPRS